MKKIAFVVQRYGLEINGGAEYHCKILAEKLNSLFDVEVLTSCAKDYGTWANIYSAGTSEVNGIKVRRFSVPYERNKRKSRRLFNQMRLNKVFPFYGDVKLLGEEWSKAQGPYLPGLIEYLNTHQREYDTLIFFTYLYYPTFCGLQIAPHKSILIPTAHDESAIHLPAYQSFFKLPRAILYNTLSEKKLVNRLFNNEDIYSDIVGVGIEDTGEDSTLNVANILNSDGPYLIYIGRINRGKGCDLMLKYFLRYRRTAVYKVKLVLVGKSDMKIVEDQDVICLGFVEDHVKNVLLKGAKALIMPSYYESLSLVTLESMKKGVPVIANATCEVLKDHIEKIGGGYSFTDFNSFKIAIDNVLNGGQEINLMRVNAEKYVNDQYNWSVVLEKVEKAINITSG